jgi:long-subunit fatty acid transport protein
MRTKICIGVITVLAAWDCQAQRPPAVSMDPRYFRVDFIIPGARPSGLAGAFIAAAQDEISSCINPAGMTYLNRPGVSTHQRWSQFEYEEPNGSAANPGTTMQFQTTRFEQSMVNLIYPIHDFSVALFRQALIDSHFDFETNQFLTINSAPTSRQLFGGLGNFPGRRVNLHIEVVDSGLAVAYAPTDRLSVGFAGRLSLLRLRLSEYLFLDPELDQGNAPRENSAQTLYSITSLDESKLGPSYDFGVLANVIRDRLFIGAVAHLRYRYRLQSDVFFPEYTVASVALPAHSVRKAPINFSIPDSQGLGVYYVITDRLRVAFDVTRVEYSDLLHGNSTNAIADDTLNAEGHYQDPDGQPDLVVDDVYEFHLGVEYLGSFPGLGIIPLRAGILTNPGHRVYANSDDPDLRLLYPKEDDRIHLAFGIGIFLIENFKLDLGLLTSQHGNSVTGSAHVAF